jgi:hypothetical protein
VNAPGTPDSLTSELATFLMPHPAAIAKLLKHHRDDGTGRCRTCASGGQRGFLVWPCTIYLAAQHAATIAELHAPAAQRDRP